LSYDNACKYLAEEYPADFVRWLLEIDTEEIQVIKTEPPTQQRDLSVCTGILAGLRFDTNLIQQLFRREIMRESAFYQVILAEGLEEGLQQGLQQGEAKLVLRQLRRRFGSITPEIETQIQTLTIPQLEALAEALLDFTDITALTTWLREQA